MHKSIYTRPSQITVDEISVVCSFYIPCDLRISVLIKLEQLTIQQTWIVSGIDFMNVKVVSYNLCFPDDPLRPSTMKKHVSYHFCCDPFCLQQGLACLLRQAVEQDTAESTAAATKDDVLKSCARTLRPRGTRKSCASSATVASGVLLMDAML